ncbi:uncharacterized protein LACBIDRAFT_323907 [Laccaria bicolor S238N-H82]|uniref:Predicted protein n=1 Tax=Laccaria bicolor (strain S238N-H82 / ATCC MYA-4686) TaxID=486041 RepID=B0D009_LACBS|nr:uncharacterized protein LACBIDRAFT_323907 [Laccaria bicolor S238N-H82]EDR11377.1 predicted protein [Laccaria bicolor S238N-H82]|eukprot:XP_001877274.1 predicted protein [Laccaria bicolor S238N-H82]
MINLSGDLSKAPLARSSLVQDYFVGPSKSSPKASNFLIIWYIFSGTYSLLICLLICQKVINWASSILFSAMTVHKNVDLVLLGASDKVVLPHLQPAHQYQIFFGHEKKILVVTKSNRAHELARREVDELLSKSSEVSLE